MLRRLLHNLFKWHQWSVVPGTERYVDKYTQKATLKCDLCPATSKAMLSK